MSHVHGNSVKPICSVVLCVHPGEVCKGTVGGMEKGGVSSQISPILEPARFVFRILLLPSNLTVASVEAPVVFESYTHDDYSNYPDCCNMYHDTVPSLILKQTSTVCIEVDWITDQNSTFSNVIVLSSSSCRPMNNEGTIMMVYNTSHIIHVFLNIFAAPFVRFVLL